jgi:cell division initiation protein
MSISPNEILEKEFHTRFRGYDPDEVDSFLEEISGIMTSLIREKNAMKDQLVSYKAQLEDLKKREEEFREALTSAHKLSEKMKSQAEKDAELVLEKAKLEAERIVADAHQEAVQLEERIIGLRRIQRETAYKIRSVLESYLRIIDEEALPPEEIDQAINLASSEMKAVQEIPDDLSEGMNTVTNSVEGVTGEDRSFSTDSLEESANEEGQESDSMEK